MVTYYKVQGGYIAVTGEYPKGFKDVLFVGRGPNSAGKIVEQAFEATALKKLTPATDVPAEWIEKLGYDQVKEEVVEERVEEEEFPILDVKGENLEALITLPVRRQRYASDPVADALLRRQLDTGLVIGVLLGFLILVASWIF